MRDSARTVNKHYKHVTFFNSVDKHWLHGRDQERQLLQTKRDLFYSETYAMQQQSYCVRKRQREAWDPRLWEMPLLPLPPQKHKKNWNENEWKFPIHVPYITQGNHGGQSKSRIPHAYLGHAKTCFLSKLALRP